LARVFSQRDNFITIINTLLQRKVMEITDSGELQFVSINNKTLSSKLLSSGEKQLLILLSETLLQRERPAVLIADEPELSLHVLWQERLIGSLRALNPAAQIVVATHSPDIVGNLGEKAVDMESLIP
jgi:predicted ATPase